MDEAEPRASQIFKVEHRAFQDRFNSRRLADRVVELTWQSEISADSKAFIESRDMFFLATVDADGRPTCSYKGGDVGFVNAIDSRTLVFPSYDGNGMYLSVGNMSANSEVGLLFVDFEKGNRLRVQGCATIRQNDPLQDYYCGAELIVRVAVSAVFPNCPRYVHRYTKVSTSAFVPKPQGETPVVDWKRLDLVHDSLPPRDQERVAATGGTITREEMLRNGQR